MRQGIVSLHLGEAGIQIGSVCWKTFAIEHGILPNGYLSEKQSLSNNGDNYKILFDEATCGRLMPRTVFIDSEPYVIDELRNNQYRNLFKCDRLVSGMESTANNYGRGCVLGKELLDEIENKIRIVTELSHNFSGFLIFHSIGGGTGSSVTALVMEKLSEEFPKKSKIEFTIFPSGILSAAIVEPYNGILGTYNTIEYSNCAFLIDNGCISDICTNSLDMDSPAFLNYNEVIASIISGITKSVRFGGSVNVQLHEFETNLVPFPRIHFPLIAYAPFLSKEQHKQLSVKEITSECFRTTNQLIKCYPQRGKFMACCFLYYGSVSLKDVKDAVSEIKSNDMIKFVNWCPTGVKVSIENHHLDHNNLVSDKSLYILSNNTSIIEAWAKLNYKFDLMYTKRAYIHWYLAEGMEEGDFIEARDDVAALENDYALCF